MPHPLQPKPSKLQKLLRAYVRDAQISCLLAATCEKIRTGNKWLSEDVVHCDSSGCTCGTLYRALLAFPAAIYSARTIPDLPCRPVCPAGMFRCDSNPSETTAARLALQCHTYRWLWPCLSHASPCNLTKRIVRSRCQQNESIDQNRAVHLTSAAFSSSVGTYMVSTSPLTFTCRRINVER